MTTKTSWQFATEPLPDLLKVHVRVSTRNFGNATWHTSMAEHQGIVLIDNDTGKPYNTFKMYIKSLHDAEVKVSLGSGSRKSGVRYLCFNSGTDAAEKWTFLTQVKHHVPSLCKAAEASPSKPTTITGKHKRPANTLTSDDDPDDGGDIRSSVEAAIAKERIAYLVIDVCNKLSHDIMHGGDITLAVDPSSWQSSTDAQHALQQITAVFNIRSGHPERIPLHFCNSSF